MAERSEVCDLSGSDYIIISSLPDLGFSSSYDGRGSNPLLIKFLFLVVELRVA